MENYNDYREIRRGEVYWCEFSFGTGSEQVGTRPVVVVSNDKCNEFSPIITVVPLTSAKKKKMPTHAVVRATSETSLALAEQLFTVSKARIGDYINCCTTEEMAWIDKCLKIQLGVYDYAAETADRKSGCEENGVRVISHGHKFFRKKCECCGARYEYEFLSINKEKRETTCPECGSSNNHHSCLGVECVERV